MAKSSSRKRSRSEGSTEPSAKRIIATNRRARHDYVISMKVEAGLALLGSEVKSLRAQGCTIREGFARVEDGELWLMGVHVPPLPQASYLNHEPMRKRKCLLHRREIRKLEDALGAQGFTLVPLSLYFQGSRIKVELGLGRGRRKEDRRQAEREKEDRKRIREVTG